MLEIIRSVARLHDEMMLQAPAAEMVCLDTQIRYALTPRECEIVELILQGKGSPQIAEKLFISTGTVKIIGKIFIKNCKLDHKQSFLTCS